MPAPAGHAATLDRELYARLLTAHTRALRKGSRLEPERGVLTLSPIFDWFEEDFAPAGGALGFVHPYLPEATRAWLARNEGRVRLAYFDYDWSLNALGEAR